MNSIPIGAIGAGGRHKDFAVYQKIDLRSGMEAEKMRRYCELLRALLSDQIAWLKDPSHARVINEDIGRNSLAMACAATQLADPSA